VHESGLVAWLPWLVRRTGMNDILQEMFGFAYTALAAPAGSLPPSCIASGGFKPEGIVGH